MILAYVVLLFVCRLVFLYGLEYDEAEQAILSQKFQWGYNQQPPLYSWCVMVLNKLMGNSLFMIIGFRNLLIFGIFYFLYQIGKNQFKNHINAIFGSASTVLIIQFSIEALKHTHTMLVTFAVVFLLWVISRLIKKPSALNYLLLGIALVIGMLSKFNFIISAFSFLFAALVLKPYRQLIFSPKIFISIFILVLLFLPHGIWQWQHLHESTRETMIDLRGYEPLETSFAVAKGLAALFIRIVWMPILFIVVTFILLKGKIKSLLKLPKNNFIYFAVIGIAFTILLFTISIIALKASDMRARWLQPVLILLPLVTFGALDGKNVISKRGANNYSFFLTIFFGIVISYSVLHITLASDLGYKESINRPYGLFVKHLNTEFKLEEKGVDLIIANSVNLAGNARYYLKDYPVEAMDYNCKNKYGIYLVNQPKKVLMISLPGDNNYFFDCMKKREGNHMEIIEQDTITLPLHYSDTRKYSFTYSLVSFEQGMDIEL